jgi:hypothetical protein
MNLHQFFRFVERGQAAQAAVDEILEQYSQPTKTAGGRGAAASASPEGRGKTGPRTEPAGAPSRGRRKGQARRPDDEKGAGGRCRT